MGHDHPLLHLINEFEAQIRKFDLCSLAMDIILESRGKLYTIISQFNYALNVEAPINKIAPDILYNIFKFAVDHDSIEEYQPLLRKAPLVVSHICQHWRRSALGWPVLWSFINTNHPQKIIELFLCRSKDTPLELYVRSNSCTNSFTRRIGQKLNLKSCANRSRCVTIQISPYEFNHIQHLFGDLELLQLKVQHLKIALRRLEYKKQLAVSFSSTMEIMKVDISCLQSLHLELLDLSLVKFPPNNMLTRFIFHPNNSPVLSHLVVFLSTCRLLRELQLIVNFSSELKFTTPTCPLTINRLDFPQLQRLVLQWRNHDCGFRPPCVNYMREFCARIGTMGQLSYFSLYYERTGWNGTPISSIFELIPLETFDHFSDQARLTLFIGDKFRHLRVSSAPECLDSSTHSLTLYGPGTFGLIHRIDRSVFELIYSMSRITHLVTYSETFRLLNPSADHGTVFRSLDTLELIDPYQMTAVMHLLPPKLKKLVLYHPNMSPGDLLDAILRTEIEILELNEVTNESELEEVISTIRQTGVVVSVAYKTGTERARFEWNEDE